RGGPCARVVLSLFRQAPSLGIERLCSTLGGPIMKKLTVGLVLSLMIISCDKISSGASAAQVRPQPNTPAYEALWRNCRRAVFKKYGYKRPDRPGKTFLSTNQAIALTDACVANGGQVS